MFNLDKQNRILQEGIRNSLGPVFMTDSLDMSEDYFHWKDTKLASPQQRAVAKLDTARMLQDHIPIFAIDRPNEFVAASIPSRYIMEIIPVASDLGPVAN